VGQETVGAVGLPPTPRGGEALVRSTFRSDTGPIQLKAAHNSDAGIGRFLEPLTGVCRVRLRTGFFAPAIWCAERTLLAIAPPGKRVRGSIVLADGEARRPGPASGAFLGPRFEWYRDRRLTALAQEVARLEWSQLRGSPI